jgi:hypothetical protein
MRFRETVSIHRKAAKDAKIKASLAELTEAAEGKILFACPGEVLGTGKETLLENRPLTDSPEIVSFFALSASRVSSCLSRTSGR